MRGRKTHPEVEKKKVVHLYVGGSYACRNVGRDSEATENPSKVTCSVCKNTKAFVYYKIGFQSGVSKMTSNLAKVLSPLLKLLVDGACEIK
jgi:hypothetical protein